MKKIIIGIIVVAVVGAGLYFGNTSLQKGSLIKISNLCGSDPNFYTNQKGTNYTYTNFDDFYNYLKNELDTLKGNTLCSYEFTGYQEQKLDDKKDETFRITCSGSELKANIDVGGKKYVGCYKNFTIDSKNNVVTMVLSTNAGGLPYIWVASGNEDSKFKIFSSLWRVKVKKH